MQLISPEVLVPRLGDQLVEMGLLTNDQLSEALALQDQYNQKENPILLGQAILELNFLDRPKLDQAITEQIFRLRQALEDSNSSLELRIQARTLELQEALRHLSELSQLKENLIANVSHELRTPLTHILGYLDLLIAETLGSINPEQKKALAVILRASKRLQTLIDDLILFSQASKGQMTLNIAPLDVKTMTAKLLTRFQPRANDLQLSLETNIDENLPSIQVDEDKITWVISQLFDNAFKFTNPGGRINLTIRKNETIPGSILIIISDTGIGISPEHITDIFEPFHQIDGSASRRYDGTGLGLSLVFQILKAHGSKINIQSEIGKGTSISFPLMSTKAS